MTLGAGAAAEHRAERRKQAAVSQEFLRKSIIWEFLLQKMKERMRT